MRSIKVVDDIVRGLDTEWASVTIAKPPIYPHYTKEARADFRTDNDMLIVQLMDIEIIPYGLGLKQYRHNANVAIKVRANTADRYQNVLQVIEDTLKAMKRYADYLSVVISRYEPEYADMNNYFEGSVYVIVSYID